MKKLWKLQIANIGLSESDVNYYGNHTDICYEGCVIMTNEDYIHFMCNPDNICNCDACPERMIHYDRETAATLPCGQFHCWVDLTCRTLYTR